jgi:hypothetical protein
MTRRKQGLGLAGLLAVAALGVMAFASSAQAVTPLFNLNGSTAEFSITGEQEGTGSLLVPTSNLTLKCDEFEVTSGLVLAGGVVAHAGLLYKHCLTFAHNDGKSLPCHVSDVHKGKPEQLHVTVLDVLFLPVEFADGKYGILAEKINVNVNFLQGTGCPLPLKSTVTGEVCFRITADNDTNKPLIQSNTTIQTECPLRKVLEGLEGVPSGGTIKDELKYGANAAFIVGSAILLDVGGGSLGVLLL